ncbi:MAG: NAD(P)H-quinone oxidoreductase [Rhodocyclaceae bacterium]|nr:NAD(P)H-quinone oxidoreductase [Rhodocyclaceae bacterium]
MRYVEYGPDTAAQSLRLADAPQPVAGAGEILIEVHAAGVNRPDVLQRQGKYPLPPGASPILGLEVAGRVAGVGAGAESWRIGDAVCALVPGGGYADYCVAPAGHALPIPAGVPMESAAALPETWFTVWANLVDLGKLKAGERVLIHGGSSGIGLTAIQLARHLGAVPLVTVGSAEKAAFCVAFGAEHAIDYKRENFLERVKALTGGAGVDVVLDMVGAPYMQHNAALLRQDGRLVIIAFLQGSRTEFDFMAVMRKRLVITGSTMRPRSNAEKTALRDALLQQIWPQWKEGRLLPHVHAVFALSEAAAAHELMESSAHIGKIVLKLRD